MIESVRGRAGGYRLAENPAEIHLGTLLLTLGKPLYNDPGYCREHAGTEAEEIGCVHRSGCTLRALWTTLEHWMRTALDQITLADLLDSEGRITDLLRSRLAEVVLEPASLEPAAPLVNLIELGRKY